jgi:hypothetical protein
MGPGIGIPELYTRIVSNNIYFNGNDTVILRGLGGYITISITFYFYNGEQLQVHDVKDFLK